MTRHAVATNFLAGAVFAGLLIFAAVQTRSFFHEVDRLRAESALRSKHAALLADLDRAGVVAIWAEDWPEGSVQWEHVWRLDPEGGGWQRADGNAEEGR